MEEVEEGLQGGVMCVVQAFMDHLGKVQRQRTVGAEQTEEADPEPGFRMLFVLAE